MKRCLYLIILVSIALSSMAQSIGDAFYIYRNDGDFNAFFRDEVDSIAYSSYDADSVYYDEIVTQLVYTSDSVYRIPLAAIDSVGFVQPEMILNDDVFLLTAEHSPYINEADTIHFVMSVATPQEFLPHKGNIVVATADCDAFTDGIVARVESITNTEKGILYQCSMVGIDEVFEQLVVFSQTVNENDEDVSEARVFNPKRASITGQLWDREWSRTIEGGGTSITVNAGDRAVVTVTARKTLTTPFFFRLEMENTIRAGIDFTAKSTVGHFEQRQIGTTISPGKIKVPYTMGLLWFTPKLSLYGYFQEEGKVELKYAGHISRTDKVSFTYTGGKWQFNHAPVNAVSTDIAQLSMDGYAEVGLRPQVDFSLNGRKTGFGFSASVGLKEYINFIFDMTKLSDGELYDAMRDSYCRTTIPWSLTAHASADIFSRYDSDFADTGFATFSHTFEPANELQWGNDRYIFPLFSDLSANRDKTDKTKAEAESYVSRSPLLPVQVGFSLLDKDKNILQTKYDSRTYSNSSLFSNYTCNFSDLKVNGEYFVCPSVKMFGYDVLASPSVDLDMHFPVTLSNFKVTNSRYQKGAFTKDGKKYDYCFDVSVTAILDDDANDVTDWGYVYLDEDSLETILSLREFGNTYTDTRYSYFRNESKSTCSLYGYIICKDSNEPIYGEMHDYPLEYICPDASHPHMIDLGLPSGTKWACCNVGANAPERYGNYYAWGETQPKGVYSFDSYLYYGEDGYRFIKAISKIGSDIAGTVYDAATANWGVPWRMPSISQYRELINNCTSVFTIHNGVNGWKFIGPNGGAIFFPAADYRCENIERLSYVLLVGCYWSSTLNDNSYFDADEFFFYSDGVDANLGLGRMVRHAGQPVRPVR